MAMREVSMSGQTFGIDDAHHAIKCPNCGHQMSLDYVRTNGYYEELSAGGISIDPRSVRRIIRLSCICEARDDAPQI